MTEGIENNNGRLKPVTLISVFAFVAVFATMLALASVYDLEISKILTNGNLAEGEYYSSNGFGLFFEAFGATPIWFVIAFSGVILFWNVPALKQIKMKISDKGKNALCVFLMIVCAVVVLVGFYFFISETFKYVFEHMGNEDYKHNGYVVALEVFVALPLSVLLIFAWKNFDEKTHKKLLRFALVMIFTAIFYLLIEVIKGPVGRMRFRTMNYLGDFSGYTPWYQINGKRNILDFVDDSCKSFPSGHTFSAAVIYSLLCLPSLFEKLNKPWIKALFYVGTIGYTMIVAISRIVVGAHFMSDVLFGGTIAFVASMLGKEMFVDGFKHFKCFGKNSNADKGDAEISDNGFSEEDAK